MSGSRGCESTCGPTFQASKGVDQLAKGIGIQADGHGVDGEVSPVLIVFKGPILDDGLATAARVALFPGAHELHFIVTALNMAVPKFLKTWTCLMPIRFAVALAKSMPLPSVTMSCPCTDGRATNLGT